MKTDSTQTNEPFNPTPTPVSSTGQALTLPLKGREIAMFLPFQGGGEEEDGVSLSE